MATHSAERAVHKTLSGTTADKVTITGGFEQVAVIERGGDEPLFVSWDGTSNPAPAVAAANDCEYVAPGGFVEIDQNGGSISVVGNGNAYSVIGVSA